ncbi:hypothetical protein L3081_05290 [Colwellia sp. MSW7]|uniref:Lipoprotein n=1 Tax=Colwellia maritima TaxID=2912588 RepID=A0ABS9WYA3_9GAMM|nr:hypothetical protein [Colwellia maritima]MCI2282910.1 hypothetical protein [Colwellia maritima]
MVFFKKQTSKGLLGKYAKVFSILLLSSTLFACSSTDDEDKSEEPKQS